MSRLLSFKEKIYKEAFYDNILDDVKNKYGFGKVKNFIMYVRDILVNYNPFIGHLPVTVQLFMRNNIKSLFGKLDVRTSTLSSAVITLVFVLMVLVWMDGFDLGYNELISGGYWSTGVYEYRSYIGQYLPFLGLEYGFPKIYTLVLSIYLMLSSTTRIVFNLVGRPVGTPILEIPINVMNRLSERSNYKREAEEVIEDSQNLSNTIDIFTERDRRVKEKILSEETLENFKRST